MKRLAAILMMLIGALHVLPVFAMEGMVTICHKPPGNEGNSKTIVVEFESAIDHLAHGDNVGGCQPVYTEPILEVFACDNWKEDIYEGEDVIFQHGIGFGTLDEALAEREGEQVFFLLNEIPLGPVFYEGITLHSEPDFYGDRGRVLWTPIPGTFTVKSWWSHPNEGPPPDECTFSVNSE